MPSSLASCCKGCQSGHSPALATQYCRTLSQHITAKRHSLFRAAMCSALASAEVGESVYVGQTPYGRGLLTCKDQRSGKRLLSVPFSQLLLLPDKVDPSFEKTQQRFLLDHGELPADLLRFLQGDFCYNCLASLQPTHWQMARDDLTDVVQKALHRNAGEARWDLRLTAWLLWLARHGSKFWKEYIQSLPKARLPCFCHHAMPHTQHTSPSCVTCTVTAGITRYNNITAHTPAAHPIIPRSQVP